MNSARFDDEILMAFADGELDDEQAALVTAAIDADPALAERVGMFLATREAARAAVFAHARANGIEDVPAALREAVEKIVSVTTERAEPDNVVSFPPAGSHSTRPHAPTSPWMRLAASVAILLAGAGGYLAGSMQGGDGRNFAELSLPGLTDTLESASSGSRVALEGDGLVELVASFRDGSGALCREFELERADGGNFVAIACHGDGEWSARLLVALPDAAGGYAPAASLEAVDAWIEATQAGAPLSAEEERQALRLFSEGRE
jgi:hypothetical protein